MNTASRSRDLAAGTRGYAAIAKTPFYVEAGGQVSDTGRLIGATSEATVERMVKQAATGLACTRSVSTRARSAPARSSRRK